MLVLTLVFLQIPLYNYLCSKKYCKRERYMGILYKETVKYKHPEFLKFAFGFTLLIFTVDVVMLLSNPQEFLKELSYIGYAMLPVAAFVSAIVWHKCKRKYKYSIIDNELIIEKLDGCKRKAVLNLNVKQIIEINKAADKQKDAVEREYDFTCGGHKDTAYRCFFIREGKLYSFCFEPSSAFISRINSVMSYRHMAS